MPICPVCRQKTQGPVCACGYDFTRAYPAYPTLCPLSPGEMAARKAPASCDLQDTLEIPASQMKKGCKASYTGNGLTLSVSVPANSREGQVLCIHGKGKPYPVTNTHGDLRLTLRAKPEKRLDLDIYENLYLTREQMQNGGEISHTQNGQKISIAVPKNTRSQQVLCIQGKGLRDGDTCGDLYLTVQEKPTPEKVEIPQEPPVDLDVHENFYLTKAQLEQGGKIPYSMGSRKISVTVPAHSQPQQVLRLVGKGKKKGKAQGNLYLTLQEKPALKKPELNLYDNLYLTREQMQAGGEIFYTQNGQKISIAVPKNTQPQQVLCIQGKGLRDEDSCGDLHLTVQEKPAPEKVEVPTEPPVDLDVHQNFYLTSSELQNGCQTQYQVEDRLISLVIPKNSKPQQVLVLKGQGKQQGRKKGNLYLTLQQKPDLKKPELNRYGELLLTKEQLRFGGEVQYIQDGNPISITVPKNSKPQQVLCIHRKGLHEENSYGNLYLTLQEQPETKEPAPVKKFPTLVKREDVQLLPLTAEECKRGCTLKVKNRQGTYQQITVPAGSTPGQTLENGSVMIQDFSTKAYYPLWTILPLLVACFALSFLLVPEPISSTAISLMFFVPLFLGRNNLLRPEIRSCRIKGTVSILIGFALLLGFLSLDANPADWGIFAAALIIFFHKKKQPVAA